MSLGDRIKEVRRWWSKARDRYWGARKNLRETRRLIEKKTKELRQTQDRIPKAQGGVKENLRKKETRLQEELKEQKRRQGKLAHQVKHRNEIYERLQKKLKFLEEKKDERQDDVGPSPGGVGFSTPSRSWNPYGRQIPNWMITWIDKSAANGWNGVVVSGVRTPEYSEQLCYNMCGSPTCSGTCAGRGSNHNMTSGQGYPYGALDVSDYYSFESVQFRIGSPLRNNLPNDAVHFSVSGR